MIRTIERTFDLINIEGAAYPLSRYNTFSGFFGEVEGLGVEHDGEYQKLGNVYNLLQDNINQGEISGVVYFQSKYPYQEYARFVEFCQSTPLKLRYVNPVGEFYRDGVVSQIEKNEDGSPKRAKITFTASSLWYKEIDETVTGTSAITINSDSAIESPCCLSFAGISLSNQSITWQQNVNGAIVMTGKLNNVTVSAQSTIYIRTDTNPYSIYSQASGGLPNSLYKNSDFSTKRFPFIRKGKNFFFILGPTPTELSVQGRILYETI